MASRRRRKIQVPVVPSKRRGPPPISARRRLVRQKGQPTQPVKATHRPLFQHRHHVALAKALSRTVPPGSLLHETAYPWDPKAGPAHNAIWEIAKMLQLDNHSFDYATFRRIVDGGKE